MPDPTEARPRLLEALAALREELDRRTSLLARTHGPRLRCRRGCCDCCRDDVTVFRIEAGDLQQHYRDLLESGCPHPPGACAFLDEAGACRVYAHRPYVCRTQGLPLRWLEEAPGATTVEYRDLCPRNETGPPLEQLPPEACWTLGPFEEALARLQLRLDRGRGARVALRSLFRHS